jgi:arginyl-tRNA synthetase
VSIDPLEDFHAEIRSFLRGHGVPAELAELSLPPSEGMGHASSAAPFKLARELGKPPRQIASEIAGAWTNQNAVYIARAEAAGAGFINFWADLDRLASDVMAAVEVAQGQFGRRRGGTKNRLLVEHTSVNPNKEWHVGHLRNACLGDTVVRLARLAGHDVEVQNYIDDTGRQAAEAIFAVHNLDQTETEDGQKFDHYIGRYYVQLNAHLTANDDPVRREQLEAGIQTVLHDLETGRYRSEIEQVVDAQLQTAQRIGASYDLLVWESDIVGAHLLEEALTLLRSSERVTCPADGKYAGALVIELDSEGSNQQGEDGSEGQFRVLVRSNGLPTYTGKDVAYMMWKFGLLQAKLKQAPWPHLKGTLLTTAPNGEAFDPKVPDRVINVVAEHQELPQQTVIQSLAAAGFAEQASKAHHLSYGMVRQSGGKIAGRKGTGSSADSVLDEARDVALERVREKQPELDESARTSISEAIAVGAVRYLMIQQSPSKPIVFDLENVVSFEGNTGLYIQYAIVRMLAVLRRAQEELSIGPHQWMGHGSVPFREPAEHRLILRLARFPLAVDDALRTLNVNLVAEYAHELASDFSQFYRDCPVLKAEAPIRFARLRLTSAARQVLSNAASALGIPVVERL